MKKLAFMSLCALMLVACGKRDVVTLVLTNELDFDRVQELVEVPASVLGSVTPTHVLTDASGVQLGYQIMHDEQGAAESVVFQATIPAGSSIELIWREKEADEEVLEPATRVTARYVPERKDDFAWENDLAAYRMYGPALAAENPSNGVDLWLKATELPVVDSFFLHAQADELYYHRLRPEGLDCYKVGDKLGCGGIAPLVDNVLWVGGHYDRWRVVERGPLRCVFVLEYDSVMAGQQVLTEQLTITVDAGSVVNKACVNYGGNVPDGMMAAAGLYLHEADGVMMTDPVAGWAVYAEEGITQTPVPEPAGRYCTAVIMPGCERMDTVQNTLVAARAYKAGDSITYYFGGGWQRWRYSSDEEWRLALEQKCRMIESPVKVEVK